MAVAHEASSESHTGTTGSASQASFTWSHLGTAPRAVVVFVYTNANADDGTAVTYGGVSMTAVTGGYAVDTAGEPRSVRAWFLDSASIPTGTQTIAVTRNNNANVMYATAASVTAASATNVQGVVLQQADGSLAEVNVDDGSPGTDSVRYAALNSALNAVPAAGANSANLQTIDFGTNIAAMCRRTSAGQGSLPVGWSTGTSDDKAAVYLAIRETPSTNRRGYVTWAEMEVPTAPRRAYVTWAELEAPEVGKRAYVTWAELEVPTAPRRSYVTWAELEVPDAPRRAYVTWAELEIPDPVRRAFITWAELEVPDAPGGGGGNSHYITLLLVS